MIENWNPNRNFLFTEEEFNKAKSRDKILPLKCLYCGKIFYISRHDVIDIINENLNTEYKFCSIQCKGKSNTEKNTTIVKCKQCGKEFKKHNSCIKKDRFNFCCKSCSAKYNNKHKIKGYRRSKIEKYIEQELTNLYPDLDIKYNSRKILPSGLELDIYILSKKIAIEINGICHYKPIYGEEKFLKGKIKDKQKEEECKELGIQLFIIDISKYNNYNKEFYNEILNKVLDFIR